MAAALFQTFSRASCRLRCSSPQTTSARASRCELAAGGSLEVIQAGHSVNVGRLRTPEGDAVAAVCCCRRQGAFLTGCLSRVRITCVSMLAKGLSLFREQSYHALNRQDAARWADLGVY